MKLLIANLHTGIFGINFQKGQGSKIFPKFENAISSWSLGADSNFDCFAWCFNNRKKDTNFEDLSTLINFAQTCIQFLNILDDQERDKAYLLGENGRRETARLLCKNEWIVLEILNSNGYLSNSNFRGYGWKRICNFEF